VFAKRFFSGRSKASSVEKDIVDQQTKNPVHSSDAKARRESFLISLHDIAITTSLEADLDLTNVIDLSESAISGYETGVDDLLVMNSTHQELDITGCSYGKQIHRSVKQ